MKFFIKFCRAVGVKTLVLTQSIFGDKSSISEQPHMFDDNRTIEELESSNMSFDDLEKYWERFELRKRTDFYSTSIRASRLPKIKALFDFSRITKYYYGK